MIQQLNRKVNQQMDKQQEALRQDILRRRQEEQDFKDEVLRLLNEINDKLSVEKDE